MELSFEQTSSYLRFQFKNRRYRIIQKYILQYHNNLSTFSIEESLRDTRALTIFFPVKRVYGVPGHHTRQIGVVACNHIDSSHGSDAWGTCMADIERIFIVQFHIFNLSCIIKLFTILLIMNHETIFIVHLTHNVTVMMMIVLNSHDRQKEGVKGSGWEIKERETKKNNSDVRRGCSHKSITVS